MIRMCMCSFGGLIVGLDGGRLMLFGLGLRGLDEYLGVERRWVGGVCFCSWVIRQRGKTCLGFAVASGLCSGVRVTVEGLDGIVVEVGSRLRGGLGLYLIRNWGRERTCLIVPGSCGRGRVMNLKRRVSARKRVDGMGQ